MTPSDPVAGRPRLERSVDDRMLAGVCGGLAEHLGAPVLAVRVGMLLFALLGGAGALLYLWLWAMAPAEGETEGIVSPRRALTRPSAGEAPFAPASASTAPTVLTTPTALTKPPKPIAPTQPPAHDHSSRPRAPSARRTRWPIAEMLLGACLLGLGVILVLQRTGTELPLGAILPAFAVLVGVGLAWWQIADRRRPERNQVPRVLGALALVAVGVLTFFATAERPNMWTVVTAALAVLAGVALAIAPWLLRLNRELLAERAARAREAERSEIAAHLHDSVLQTLALIQQRSEPGSEVSRIARGQERELREWLFRAGDGGVETPRETAASALEAHAASLEQDHAVRFDIVSVGGEAIVPEPIVAAAREAMLNAARHAGGTVTVFVEATASRVSIDITDRGPGLSLDALPEGRMGVRDSILGRMERTGGSARIVPGPGGTGTSVRLSLDREEQPSAQTTEQKDTPHE